MYPMNKLATFELHFGCVHAAMVAKSYMHIVNMECSSNMYMYVVPCDNVICTRTYSKWSAPRAPKNMYVARCEDTNATKMSSIHA